MKPELHLILTTDAPVSEILRLGMLSFYRSMLEFYNRFFEVHVYSLDFEDHSPILQVRHHPLGPRSRVPRWTRAIIFYLRLLRQGRRMRGVIRSLSPNLPVLPELRRLSGRPVLVDFHYDWAATSRAHYRGLKRLLARPVQRRCLRHADLVIATTSSLRLEAKAWRARRVVTIPNFVDPGLFQPAPLREPAIIFAGRLHWAKGVATLISAFARCAERIPDCRLLILGSGEEEAALRRQAAGLEADLSPRIRFLGSLPQEEVARLLGSARICALPTLTSEGNPKIVLESMACGTPLVATRVPGLSGLITEGVQGILVPPGSADALAEALLEMMANRPQWEGLSRNCLIRSRRFAKERVLRRQVRVMQICAGQMPG